MSKYINIYVPHCNDIAAMDVSKTPYGADKVDDKCLVANFDNESEIFMLRLVAAVVRVVVLDYYQHSGSFLWHPEPEDEVYRIITPDESAIRQMHVFHDSEAVDQFNYIGNCYRTEKEADELLTIIKLIFKRHNFLL